MAKKKEASPGRLGTEPYRTFESNLDKLAYFVGTTEQWYERQAKKLRKRATKASSELDRVELEMEQLVAAKTRLPKDEEQLLETLQDRASDLFDIEIFAPMEAELFHEFAEMIRQLSLVYLVAIFEAYVVDVIRDILLVCPDALKSGKKVTYEEVLENREQVVTFLAEKEVGELLYKAFPDMAKYFNEKFNIDVSDSEVSTEAIVEILETRNIHIHNKGIVNRKYLKRVQDSKFKLGYYRPITQDYLKDAIDLVSRQARFINNKVQEKYFT